LIFRGFAASHEVLFEESITRKREGAKRGRKKNGEEGLESFPSYLRHPLPSAKSALKFLEVSGQERENETQMAAD